MHTHTQFLFEIHLYTKYYLIFERVCRFFEFVIVKYVNAESNE